MSDVLNNLNDVVKQIHEMFNSLEKYSLNDPNDKCLKFLPKNGIYVIFENGEKFLNSDMDRIVRVGTHKGENRLLKRLKSHYHIRGINDRSIFRKHIGRAIICKEKKDLDFLELWGKTFVSRESKKDPRYNQEYFEKKRFYEDKVDNYVQNNIRFTVIPVESEEKRLYFEGKLISTLSWSSFTTASENWLGNFSPIEKIRNSRLWNVNELFKQPLSDEDFEQLMKIFNSMK